MKSVNEIVTTLNGLHLPMQLLKVYVDKHNARHVFIAQDRICITDGDNKEIKSIDLLEIVHQTLIPVIDVGTDTCVNCGRSARFYSNSFPFCSDICMSIFIDTPEPNDHYIDINERYDTLSDED